MAQTTIASKSGFVILNLTAVACTLGAAAPGALAERYPSKSVRVIVPFPPSGAIDWTARIVATRLGEKLGTSFVVDNRPGAGGRIAAELTSKAAADGYTLLQGTASNAISTAFDQSKLPHFGRDFTPIALIGSSIFILVAHPTVPVTNLKDLIGLAKAKPGGLDYASAGIGTTNHLTMELLKSMAGIDLLHVPYKGGGPAMADQVAGRVALGFSNTTVTMPHIKTGRLRPLATSGTTRAAVVPDIPTVAEAGVPGFDSRTWYGFVAPRNMDVAVVELLNRGINEALRSADVQDKFVAEGITPGGGSPADFGRLIAGDIAKWGKIIQAAGIKPQ